MTRGSARADTGDQCRIAQETTTAMLKALAARGIDEAQVEQAIGCASGALGARKLSWNVYCDLTQYAVDALGGVRTQRDLGHLVAAEAHSQRIAKVMGYMASPAMVYKAALTWVWPSLFPMLEFEHRVDSATQVTLQARIPRPLRPCEGWFYHAQGVLETMPRMVGFEASAVQIQVAADHRSGTFVIHHAASRSLWLRLRTAVRALFSHDALLQELRDYVEESDRKLRDLADAQAQAEAALELQDRFLTNANHELRTPLAGADGLVQMLRTVEDVQEVAPMLDELERCHDDLARQVHLLVERSLLAHGDITLTTQAFDLAACVRRACSGLGSHVELADVEGIHVLGDPIRVGRMVHELVRNAASHGEGEVHVAVRFGPGLRLVVEDGGPGFPPHVLAGLDEAFVQGDGSLTRAVGGMGLGLWLARGLADHMGGTLQLANREEGGARCMLALPLELATVTPTEVRGDTILVVDDNELNRRILGMMVRRVGFEVLEAENGAVAVRLALEHRPGGILMDCQMPVMDGFEATRRIRRQWEGEPPLILAVTAHAQPGYARRCFEAGMDHYVAKPVDAERLSRLLGRPHRDEAVEQAG